MVVVVMSIDVVVMLIVGGNHELINFFCCRKVAFFRRRWGSCGTCTFTEETQRSGHPLVHCCSYMLYFSVIWMMIISESL